MVSPIVANAQNDDFEIDINGSLVDCLDYFAVNRATHPAVEAGDQKLDFATLKQRSDEVAANLQADGVRAGDIVALILDDDLDHAIMLCALARLGGIIYSALPSEPEAAIQENLTELGAKAAIAKDSAFTGVRNLSPSRVTRASGLTFSGSRVAGDQAVFVNRSSGTTGKAKSFLLSHKDNLFRAKRSGEAHGWQSDDRYLCLSSLGFGLGRGSFFFTLQYGMTYILTRSFVVQTLVEFVSAQQITILKLTPSFILPLLEYGKEHGPLFPNLRSLATTSAPLTPVQRRTARRLLNANFREQYGTNETGMLTLSLPRDQDTRPDSVGRLLDVVEAKTVDRDGQSLPPGQAGHVAFRLPVMLSAYENDAAATTRAFRDGWYFPGDIAVIDEERFVFLKGRADDVINNAGVKIYPIECEQLLQSYPPIIEVAAFPLPHKVAGQVVAACFVADEIVDISILRRFCRTRAAPVKTPSIMRQIKEMPRNAMGKIDKRKLRARLLKDIEA